MSAILDLHSPRTLRPWRLAGLRERGRGGGTQDGTDATAIAAAALDLEGVAAYFPGCERRDNLDKTVGFDPVETMAGWLDHHPHHWNVTSTGVFEFGLRGGNEAWAAFVAQAAPSVAHVAYWLPTDDEAVVQTTVTRDGEVVHHDRAADHLAVTGYNPDRCLVAAGWQPLCAWSHGAVEVARC